MKFNFTIINKISPCITMTIFVLSVTAHSSLSHPEKMRLINSTPVPAGTYSEVVTITANGANCVATIVGPRTIITAASCVSEGARATFNVNGKSYETIMARSPLYLSKEHNIAVGSTNNDIDGVKPAFIDGTASVGREVTIFGSGCTSPNSSTSDGIMRMGNTVITSVSEINMVSRKAGGAAICFGDQGGPAMIITAVKHSVVGINHKGDMKSTNYSIRTDINETVDFLKNFATSKSVAICGINSECGEQPAPLPSCTLTASPTNPKIDETVTLTLQSTNATSAKIEDSAVEIPTGQTTYKATTAGTFVFKGYVYGTAGQSECAVSITVSSQPIPTPIPSCTLVSTPDVVQLKEQVILTLTSQGSVEAAYIDGSNISVPVGSVSVMATTPGVVSVSGRVEGPGGVGICSTTYTVTSNPVPSDTPNFAIVPAYCGENSITSSNVQRVCLSVVKKDQNTSNLLVTDAVLITYRNLSEEVMPIINRVLSDKVVGSSKVAENLTLYANASLQQNGYLVLDTRLATLTKLPAGKSGEIPSAIEGITSTGASYNVPALRPPAKDLNP